MKKSFAFIICVFALLSCLCGCSVKGSQGSGTNTEFLLDESVFSEAYLESKGFKEIRQDVIEYYNLARTAYDQSDKETFSSFNIDQDRFDSIYDDILAVTDSYKKSDEDRDLMVNTAIHICLIKRDVAGLNLWKTADPGGKHKDTFITLQQDLDEAYQNFTQYKTEEKSQKPSTEKTSADPIVGQWEFIHISRMSSATLIWPEQLKDSGFDVPVFECVSDSFYFTIAGVDISGAWEEADPDSIKGVNRDILKAYTLGNQYELAAYFGESDHFDYKYIYLKMDMDGTLYEMRFQRKE